uniref:Uncharacterized protein n=1 Tax=Anguilla anguilla TaxID=7936 RepID=A0A0E9U8B5_ANGAN
MSPVHTSAVRTHKYFSKP